MSREFTNYQTLAQAKIRNKRLFEEKRNAVKARRSANEELMNTFVGTAADTYKARSDEMLRKIDELEAKADAKLDKDLGFWRNQLDETELKSAREFDEKIGLV